MAQRTPPSWLQNGSHPAENDRLTQQAVIGASNGVIGGGSYAVTAQGSPNMTVNVAAGYATLVGGSPSTQGSYVATNDATVVQTITTADGTFPRIDIIYLQVNDSAYSGSLNSVTLSYLTGTPAASPVAPVPTGSATYYVLAQILVNAGASSITNSNITDLRSPVLTPLTTSATQYFRNTSIANTLSANQSIFTTNRPFLLSGRNYQVSINLIFTKNTSGTITWALNNSAAVNMYGNFQLQDTLGSNIGGYVINGATLAASSATGTYSTTSTYSLNLTGVVQATANTRLQFVMSATSAGTITPQVGSQITVTDLGSSNTVGNIG